MSKIKVKITTNLTHRVNQTITTEVGNITFDENLEAEIDEVDAEILIKSDIGISLLSEKEIQTSILQNKEETEEEKIANAKAEAEKEKHEVQLALNKKTVPELQAIAKEGNLPEEDWKDLKKAELVVYLSEH